LNIPRVYASAGNAAIALHQSRTGTVAAALRHVDPREVRYFRPRSTAVGA